jgi:hypothetical protein
MKNFALSWIDEEQSISGLNEHCSWPDLQQAEEKVEPQTLMFRY